jgi:hypothetical protein
MVTVFVEGVADQQLIEHLLADLVQGGAARVIASGGRDAARPRARKELLVRRRPVALVINSGTLDASRVAQQQRDLEDYLDWGGHGLGAEVIQFVPEAEVLFFHAPAVLERILHRGLDPDTVVAGGFAPRAVLERLALQAGSKRLGDLFEMLSPLDLEVLREQEPIARLRTFIAANADQRPARRSA